MIEQLPAPDPEQRIGQGRTAEVFALDDQRVLKLLRTGFDPASLFAEADKTAAAHASGAPAPQVHGIVEVEGRPGIVLDKIDGDVLLDDITAEPFRLRSWAHLLAEAHVAALQRRTDDLPALKHVYAHKIEVAPLDDHHRGFALDILEALPDGNAVLHGDVHPGNLMRTASGSVLIDWVDATRGDPAADIARTSWLLSPATISPGNPNRRTMTAAQAMFRSMYRTRCVRKLGISRRSVDAWRVPVVAARLSEGIEHEEAALRTELSRRIDG